MPRITSPFSFYRTVKDEYFTGPRKKLDDGSIELRGKRWGLVAMILLPSLGVLITVFEMLNIVARDDKRMMITVYIGFGVCCVLMAVIMLVLLTWVPRRRVFLEASLGSILIEHRGLTWKKDIVVNLEEIDDVKVVDPPKQGPLQRPRIYLKTKEEELYLVSVGRYYANRELPSEIKAMVDGWNKKR